MSKLSFNKEFLNRYTFLILALMAIVIGVALLFSATDYYVNDTQKRFTQLVGETPEAVWRELLYSRAELLVVHQADFTKNAQVLEVLESKNSVLIEQSIAATIKEMRAHGHLADLQVIGLDGELLYSSHQRKTDMTALNAWDLNRVLFGGGVISGRIYKTSENDLRIIYAFPLRNDDSRIVAAVVLEEMLTDTLDRLAHILGNEVLLVEGDFLHYASVPEIKRELDNAGLIVAGSKIDLLDRSYLASSFSITGSDSLTQLQIVSLSDQTDWYRTESRAFYLNLAFAVVFLGAIFGAVYRMVVLSEKRISDEQRREIEELARLNQERSQALADLELANQNLRREVGERKILEAETQVLSRAVEQSPAAVVITDVEGNIQYVNPSFCRASGYTREELIDQNPRILKTGHTPPEEYKHMWKTIAAGEEWHGEFHNRKKNGELYWVSSAISGIRNNKGNVVHYVAVKEDITEKKLTEERMAQEREEQTRLIKKLEDAHNQLLQSEKMASIGQLAAGVAHEINNPVGFVSSNLNALEDYIGDLLSLLEIYSESEDKNAISDGSLEKIWAKKNEVDLNYIISDIKKLMAESSDGLTRVKKIVQDLKDFSHADKGEWDYSDLHQGLDSTLNVVWNEIKYKAKVFKEYGNLPNVECLPSQLNQVFMNLLVNAAQAIKKEGTITIRTGCQDERVWIEIEDTGKGIPESELHRIFDPFFTTKSVGKGTGLGLSLAYGIIDKHNGNISVESEVGKGTIFRIVLPKNHEQIEEATAIG